MKIAMFGHKRIPSREGGVEIVVEELSTRMAEKGHRVVCYNRSDRRRRGHRKAQKALRMYKGVKLRSVWTIPKRGLAAMSSSFFAAIRASFSSCDVVHIHAEGPAAMSFLPKLFGKKVIVTIHGLDWQRAKWGGFASNYIKWGEKQAVKHADGIIVLSKRIQDYFLDTYGRKTCFIPNGIDKKEKLPADIITKRWGLQKESYLLFVGRIVPEKGLQYLLEAWKDLSSEKKLVIVGGSSDTDEYFKELKERAGENVIFTGFQQGKVLAELYSNAYIYCLPSDLEGMPISLLEAMSYGNCCVVSDIAECTEVVEDRAVVFPKGDVEGLRNRLNELLKEPALVRSFQEVASDYICGKYQWDDVTNRTLAIYQQREQYQ